MNAPAHPVRADHVRYFPELTQGSEEWLAARRGILTASEMRKILTPTLKVAANDDSRAHVYELLAQRISGYVEPSFIGDDMLRGMDDEIYARMAYVEHVAPVQDMGFITNSKWGFTLGYSPDGLIGDDGLIEIKSRKQKLQVQTIIDHVATGGTTIPKDYVMQCQTGLLVTERKWLDFISYSGGLHMVVIRVYPDPVIQSAIIEAATAFEESVSAKRREFLAALDDPTARLFSTERRIVQEIYA